MVYKITIVTKSNISTTVLIVYRKNTFAKRNSYDDNERKRSHKIHTQLVYLEPLFTKKVRRHGAHGIRAEMCGTGDRQILHGSMETHSVRPQRGVGTVQVFS